MEAKELVDIIQKAADDKNISALYADFGEGMRYPVGYAHIEDIRNAVRIFNESHRPSYAFGYSFHWSEYFLASAFSHVHLQSRGSLDLFGATVNNLFLRSALDKYGVKAHVFKHGDYKTAPNVFTEKVYSKPHLETVKSMTASLNNTIRTCIRNSRALNFDDVMWQSISDYGSLTAVNAEEIGLVDSTPSVDPLPSLLEANKSDDAKAKLEQNTATSLVLSGLGIYPNDVSQGDKVAVVTVDGGIGRSLAYEIISSLRKIRKDKDVKCLVLRVNSPGGSVVSSEAILEEVKALEIVSLPVVCSMANYAASGGYYISTNAERIFAQPTTLTGSIGVYGIKFDASQWAKSYGIRSDYYPHGSHGATVHPLTPLTQSMKLNLDRTTLGYYDYFKSIVAKGRSLSPQQVESIAQGRVWTGEQAKEVGLVDAIGGLERAISYVKSAHTTTEKVQVEYWPKKSS
ncbi:hypothetical protein THAPSDRAFT_261589, partial [Thalassiosira pseudonana CCMP1335]